MRQTLTGRFCFGGKMANRPREHKQFDAIITGIDDQGLVSNL
jgi:hypothetical protein